MEKVLQSLAKIKRVAPETLLAGLKSENERESTDAGQKLIRTAASYGVELKDYLRLAINPKLAADKDRFEGLNGFETTLAYLDLPVKDDFDNGISLDLASDTFQTYPGTRAMFPEVIDTLLQWKYRQDQFEKTENIVSTSRTINGVELLTTVVEDATDGTYSVIRPVAELANIPVQSIRTSQHTVKMWKIGGGYRTSYEFSRRARLDVLTPYAARINRELERSKVAAATSMLLNGDAIQPAAPVVTQSSFNGGSIGTATAGSLAYKNLIAWLVSRAKGMVPVDIVVGNWDAYIEWLLMFAVPLTNGGFHDVTAAENMARGGFKIGGVPIMDGFVKFAISSSAPESQLIGITKSETLEELIEAGSLITEAERAVTNQSITYIKSEVSGYRLVYPDTRSVFNYNA